MQHKRVLSTAKDYINVLLVSTSASRVITAWSVPYKKSEGFCDWRWAGYTYNIDVVFLTQTSELWGWLKTGYDGERQGLLEKGRPGYVAMERQVSQGRSKVPLLLIYWNWTPLHFSFFFTDVSHFILRFFPNPIPGNPFSSSLLRPLGLSTHQPLIFKW